MRVAYLSPMPPSTSGIADYSALLVPVLAGLVDLRVAGSPDTVDRSADLAVYHVGNSAEEHSWIVEELRRRPGVVVLHEYALHHLIAGMTIARGDIDGYLAAMQRDAGVVGRLVGHGVADGVLRPVWETRGPDFPLVGEVLDHATLVIVHSATVEEEVRRRGYAGPIHRIPHPAWPAPVAATDNAVRDLLRPVFGVFGHLNANKRIPEILAALRLLQAEGRPATLLLVGGASEDGADVDDAAADGIVRLPYVDEARLSALMCSVDAVLNLRHPTMGETSGIAVRALGAGVPLVVSDVGWFSELPDEIAFKVPVGPGEVEAIAAAMRRIADEPVAAARRAEAGQQFARDAMGAQRVAELYRRALVEAAGGDEVRRAVLSEFGAAAADVGLPVPEQDEVARRLREASL